MTTPARPETTEDMTEESAAALVRRIGEAAREAGFDGVRLVRAADVPDRTAFLRGWVGAGRHGQMGWMEETAARRGHPASLWPDVKAIIVPGQNYGRKETPLPDLEKKEQGTFSF